MFNFFSFLLCRHIHASHSCSSSGFSKIHITIRYFREVPTNSRWAKVEVHNMDTYTSRRTQIALCIKQFLTPLCKCSLTFYFYLFLWIFHIQRLYHFEIDNISCLWGILKCMKVVPSWLQNKRNGVCMWLYLQLKSLCFFNGLIQASYLKMNHGSGEAILAYLEWHGHMSYLQRSKIAKFICA